MFYYEVEWNTEIMSYFYFTFIELHIYLQFQFDKR